MFTGLPLGERFKMFENTYSFCTMSQPFLQHVTAIVHLDTAIRGAHLLSVYGSTFIPYELHFFDTLRAFRAYYINKHADHRMHEIAFRPNFVLFHNFTEF
jgi:hypothetical protein